MINKKELEKLYNVQNKSMKEIADLIGCSPSKVQYWMVAHGLVRKTISEAVYTKNNPEGDPFVFCPPKSLPEERLFGMGMGLYWGEGTKASKSSVRLGNSDPELISKFITFLITFFNIKKQDLHFGLQIFSDMSTDESLGFWIRKLKVKKEQFYKPIITPYRSIGNYRSKTKYGVVTVYYNNTKLKKLLMDLLEKEKNDIK